MEFNVKSGSPEKQRSACIVVGVFEPRRLSPVAEQLDEIVVQRGVDPSVIVLPNA